MYLPHAHYRNFDENRMIYRGGAAKKERAHVTVETSKERKDQKETSTVGGIEYVNKSAGEIWQQIDETYGKSAYESKISEYVDQLMPKGDGDFKSDLVSLSVRRYMHRYHLLKKDFMSKAEILKEDLNYTIVRIQTQAKRERAVLKASIEASKPLADFNEEMPSPKDKEAVKKHFGNYLSALYGRYFNVDVNEGIKVPRTGIMVLGIFLHPDKKTMDHTAYPEEKRPEPVASLVTGSDVLKGKAYEQAAERFQGHMQRWVSNKLDWLLARKGTTTQDLIAFREEIANRYELYASIDENSAIISGGDLVGLERVASKLPLDALNQILEAPDARILTILEVVYLMNPKIWKKFLDMNKKLIPEQAVADGSEEQFIARVNALRKARGQEPVKKGRRSSKFWNAKKAFEEMLDEVGKVGAKETIAFVNGFYQSASADILEFAQEDEIIPPALAEQVNKQLDYLMGGQLTPAMDPNKTLVIFMRSGKKGREAILADDASRDTLFRGIRLATERYPDMYEKKYRRLPKERKKLKESENIETPSPHDQAAQFQALTILGRQARVIVERYSKKPKHKDRGYMEEMEEADIPENAEVIAMDTRFKSPGVKVMPYVSAVQRHGLNTPALFLKGTKIAAVAILFANLANEWKNSDVEGADFMERLASTAERLPTSQGAVIGALALVGSHMAERNPILLKYPWLSEPERKGARMVLALNDMAARVGSRRELERFLNNNAEWRAMNHPDLTRDSVEQLIKDAQERAKKTGGKPIITVKDMESVIDDPSIIATLTRDVPGNTSHRSARTRFLFYKKYLMGKNKPDIHHLKELCEGTSYISPGSANKEA